MQRIIKDVFRFGIRGRHFSDLGNSKVVYTLSEVLKENVKENQEFLEKMESRLAAEQNRLESRLAAEQNRMESRLDAPRYKEVIMIVTAFTFVFAAFTFGLDLFNYRFGVLHKDKGK